MHEVSPKPIDVSYQALLALFGKEGIIDLIGKKRVIETIGEERVLDLIGEEEVRRWLARRGQATFPETGNSLAPDEPIVTQCEEPASDRSKPSLPKALP